MALLLPTADCKITDVGAFKTHLSNNLSSISLFAPSMSYTNPQLITGVTFARAEQVTEVLHLIGFGTGSYGKYYNLSLTQYKSCTVSSATPAVVTITAHGYTTGDKVRFTASTVPTGMVRGLQYFVNVQSANTFWIYDTYANAIAGGATGRVNTTSTGSSVVCHKIIEEKSYRSQDFFGTELENFTSTAGVFAMSRGWTTVVDTTANKWNWLFSTDDATSPSFSVGTSHVASFGTTTASAVSGTDGIVFDKKVDMTTGFTIGAISAVTGDYTVDPLFNQKLIVDPTSGTIGNLIMNNGMGILCASYSSVAFGKPIEFTAPLTAGDTSATLTSNFTGITGTYTVQTLYDTENGTSSQVSMSFTNGSTNVTFSALPYNGLDYGVICIPQSANFEIRMNTNGYIQFSNSLLTIEASYIHCSEQTRKSWTTLDAGLTVGTNTLTTQDVTNWTINDTFYIGGNIVSGVSLMDETVYTVTGISSSGGKDTITFSPNLATYDRAVKGCVTLKTATTQGIKMVRTTGSNSSNITGAFAGYVVSGSDLEFVSTSLSYGTLTPKFLFSRRNHFMNCWGAQPFMFNPPKSATVDTIAFSQSTFPSTSESTTFLYTTTSFYKNILFYRNTGGGNTLRFNVSYNNLRIEGKLGSGSQSLNISPVPTTSIKNLYIWVTNTNSSGLLYGGFKSTVENIYIDGAFNGLKCVGNTFGVRLKNLYLGSIRANTYDITILSGASGMDAVLDTIYSNPTISVSERSNIVDGGFLRILNLNNVSGENRVIQTFGDSYITGSSLSDTTLHNGNPCLKFRSVSGYFPMSWEQTIPTGDIQNRDMMVGVWVKLNSANYWAGLNQMPRLTINYDDGTIAYAEASQSTDWQYLFVPFTPTTTFGSIKAKLTSMTDATTTDADVYFSDMSVLYPAGYTLNLGKFDNLNDGFPVVPTISTSVSAQDVWSADPDQFGADTVGDKVNKIKNDTGLIPATL